MNKTSIRTKLIVIGAIAAIGFSSLVAIGWSQGSRTQSSVETANAMTREITVVRAMQLANVEMTLAAMDSIIDRDEGVIQPERLEVISNALATIRNGADTARSMAEKTGRPALMDGFEADVAEVAEAIQVTLPGLIESGASQAEFAALDDAIDGGGERLNENLSELARVGDSYVQAQLAAVASAAQQTKTMQSVSAVAFLVLVVGFTFWVGRGIIRSLSVLSEDMKEVAAGDLTRDIHGAENPNEIGRMAQTLVSFRQALADKARSDEEAARTRSEKERLDASTAEERARDEERRAHVINALSTGLERLSQGDLSYRITESFAPEYEKLRGEFNTSVDALRTTMEEIAAGTGSVQLSATEIGSASDDLSKRTEQQAASLEETAAALDQITATVRNTSQRADEASAMVASAKSGAEKSGSVVRNAIGAMQKIEESSGRISQIISVIDDIAFQTNLLALNAGVEAARAGEAGKGFAVVAQEVRELAQRSATAAKEIKDLIETSTSQVGAGVALVNETGDSLGEIEVEVAKINDHITSIVTTSREQANGLAEINTAINQMDQMTQQNVAMVEQTNAATQGLTGEALKLEELVRRFRLAADATNTAAAGGQTARVHSQARPAPQPVAPAKSAHPAPARATQTSRPAPSPARALGQKIASAFGTGNQAASEDGWSEF
ncbi:MAG: methyl-accepting chemotaxis protein [Roseitalea porphyridii]|uniref:methyl-accepting chemotaxis protein n=1 Tax=Roseitalea porphyridii TaxID=1852022 RepID=UPI0032EBB429